MPEVVRALAAPLANVDKITIVSTGNGASSGMHKITGDLTEIPGQVPALFEALSGMKISDLMANVKAIGDRTQKPPKTQQNGTARTRIHSPPGTPHRSDR